MVYIWWPETARLSLEEVAQQFGDEVAVHINDASQEERDKLDHALEQEGDITHVTVGNEVAFGEKHV